MSQKRRFLSSRLSVLLATLVLVFFASVAHSEEFTNYLGMKLVSIPAGSFKMGAPDGEVDVGFNEFPQREVNVPRFQMSRVEVTLGQFKRYILATNRTELVTDAFMDANAQGDDAPVVFVSWNDANSFLIWLNNNKPATDHGTYRLPNESEWEYACHAGGYEPYCGSRTPSAIAWHEAISGSHQQAVGRKEANAFGLYDMSGNALEWVEDCYHDTYNSAPKDGSAWTTACTSNSRVLRGGSWKAIFQNVRATIRFNATPLNRANDSGFRVVRQI